MITNEQIREHILEHAISLLNKYRNNHYNDTDYSKVEIANAINEVLPLLSTLRDEHEALKKELAKSVGYCSKIQNEFNTLKKDVARYFALAHNPTSNTNPNEIRPYIEWSNELIELEKQILSKAGKEE